MWDHAGRLSRVNRPNGTSRVLTYDRAGQLTRIDDRNADGVLLVFRQYNYDADGRLTSRFALPKPHPVPATTDARTYDVDNRLATAHGTAVTHDADGNLTSGPLTAEQFATYTFDGRNRLTSVDGVSYSYDAEYNRTTMATTAGGTHDVVDPHGSALPRVLMREQPNGGQTVYVYGLGLLYEVDTAGNATYYHYDMVGSTVALSDAGGFVTDRMEYAPFGTLVYRRGTTDTSFLYAGHWGIQTDPNGLLYMRARYYNPVMRRFVRADPIGFAGGLNWYAYATNNPYRYVDPEGHIVWDVLDVGLFGYSTYRFLQEPSLSTSVDVVLDGVGLLPLLPALGTIRRVGTEVVEGVATAGAKRVVTKGGLAPPAPTVAGRGASPGPGFVVTPRGEAIRVPTGATGPTPTRASGVQYTGGSGGKGLDSRVTGVRIMEGNGNQGPRAGYMNRTGQTVAPGTGGTVSNKDPHAHHYLQSWK